MTPESKRIRNIGEEAIASIIMADPDQQMVSAICALMGMVGEVAQQIAELRADIQGGPKLDPSKFN